MFLFGSWEGVAILGLQEELRYSLSLEGYFKAKNEGKGGESAMKAARCGTESI
jgi:hypothetical protein